MALHTAEFCAYGHHYLLTVQAKNAHAQTQISCAEFPASVSVDSLLTVSMDEIGCIYGLIMEEENIV